MDANELKNQIDELIASAETGADWAEICRLEAELVEIMAEQSRFGADCNVD